MKSTKMDSILLIGIGNCGRGDDGLGWQFLDLVSPLCQDSMDIEYRYQLQIEDADLISNYDKVIFIDASHDQLCSGYQVKKCEAANHYYFSSHVQCPETILYLINDLYDKFPEAYTMAISGEYWELHSGLSEKAQTNLGKAIAHFTSQYLTAQA